MICWICQEHPKCPHTVCYEQETTEQIKNEQMEMRFSDEQNLSREVTQ